MSALITPAPTGSLNSNSSSSSGDSASACHIQTRNFNVEEGHGQSVGGIQSHVTLPLLGPVYGRAMTGATTRLEEAATRVDLSQQENGDIAGNIEIDAGDDERADDVLDVDIRVDVDDHVAGVLLDPVVAVAAVAQRVDRDGDAHREVAGLGGLGKGVVLAGGHAGLPAPGGRVARVAPRLVEEGLAARGSELLPARGRGGGATGKDPAEDPVGVNANVEAAVKVNINAEAVANVKIDVEAVANVKVDVEPIANVKVDVEPVANIKVDVEAIANVKVDIEAVVNVKIKIDVGVGYPAELEQYLDVDVQVDGGEGQDVHLGVDVDADIGLEVGVAAVAGRFAHGRGGVAGHVDRDVEVKLGLGLDDEGGAGGEDVARDHDGAAADREGARSGGGIAGEQAESSSDRHFESLVGGSVGGVVGKWQYLATALPTAASWRALFLGAGIVGSSEFFRPSLFNLSGYLPRHSSLSRFMLTGRRSSLVKGAGKD
ncbi:hypothetical protein MKZ38_000011 [Zalerion maritima]|uniref:Uncharacterized protein n=1 Tax=Zalerion maritima TaxID=339359 RepID=A0AAD5RGD0_9PEZI|nr:hypothetical protein MKZ38_000011 [Zalerion maritima]